MGRKIPWVVEINQHQLDVYYGDEKQSFKLLNKDTGIENSQKWSAISNQIFKRLCEIIERQGNKPYQIIWVIQPTQSVRKELTYEGLSKKELKKVLMNEAYYHLHLEQSTQIAYQYIIDPLRRTTQKALVSAIPEDIKQLLNQINQKLDVHKYTVIEKCDILATMFPLNELEQRNLVIDIDNEWVFIVKRGICISSEKITMERLLVEVLKKVRYYEAYTKEILNIHLIGDVEKCNRYSIHLSEVLQQTISYMPYNNRLFREKTLKYKVSYISNGVQKSIKSKALSEKIVVSTFAVVILLGLINIYLRDCILNHSKIYQDTYDRYVKIQQQRFMPENHWVNLAVMDTLLGTLDESSKLVHLQWSEEFIEWSILNDSLDKWYYGMMLGQLFPDQTIKVKDNEQGYQTYWMSMKK